MRTNDRSEKVCCCSALVIKADELLSKDGKSAGVRRRADPFDHTCDLTDRAVNRLR